MLGLLSGCSAKNVAVEPSETVALTQETTYIADGAKILSGLWSVCGIYIEGKLIDVNDNEVLADLYDTDYLSISDDGTFEFLGYFSERGTFSRYEKGYNGYTSFLLHTEECFTSSFENGQIVETPNESSEKRTYLVEVPNGDENTLILHKFDPLTGGYAADDDPHVYVRNGCESSFLAKYKTPIG